MTSSQDNFPIGTSEIIDDVGKFGPVSTDPEKDQFVEQAFRDSRVMITTSPSDTTSGLFRDILDVGTLDLAVYETVHHAGFPAHVIPHNFDFQSDVSQLQVQTILHVPRDHDARS